MILFPMIYTLFTFFSPVLIALLKFLKIGHTRGIILGQNDMQGSPLPLVTLVIDENKISTDKSKTPPNRHFGELNL
jgi:hypothetical protein